MNFIKLKDQFFFTEDDIQNQDEQKVISYGNYSGDQIVKSFHIDTSNPKIQKIYNLFPEYAQSFFGISGFNISNQLVPHTDDVKTSIMFYINTSGCKIQFYKMATDNPEVRYCAKELNGQEIPDLKLDKPEIYKTNLKSYKPELFRTEDLIEDSYFIAKNNDAYCIDGTKPHALISLNGQAMTTIRSFICVTTPMPFLEVVSLLRQTNSI
jgi:hypothetical protein